MSIYQALGQPHGHGRFNAGGVDGSNRGLAMAL